MKKYILLLLPFILLGCGQYQEEPLDQRLVTTPTTYDVSERHDPQFNYKKFLLKVDYKEGLTYQVRFDETQKIAQIHELKDQTVFGKDAFNQLSPHLMELNFDENTPETIVIQDVLETLGLKKSFKQFALDVQFSNGLEKNYKR